MLVVYSGRPLVLTWASQHVGAILQAWFPGTEAGHALSQVLYGDAAPSGKLPMSVPYTEGQEPLYYNQLPTGRPAGNADLSQPPTSSTRFVSRYIDAPNAALFPFGFGLSYTTFAYSNVALSRTAVPIQDLHPGAPSIVIATAMVKNTGDRAATEVAQCYVRNRGASLEQPVRSLQGFASDAGPRGIEAGYLFRWGSPSSPSSTTLAMPEIRPTDYTVWIGGDSMTSSEASFHITPQPRH